MSAVEVQAKGNPVRFEFPQQPCLGFLQELDVRDVRTRINGTRAGFSTRQYKGGEFDDSSTLYMQISTLGEFARSGKDCSVKESRAMFLFQLNECQCRSSRIDYTENQVHTEGWRLDLYDCPEPQSFLTFSLNVTSSNATTSKTYSPTMEGSYLPELVYTT